jgi:hypothetical protein
MVEEKMAQREHDPEGMAWQFTPPQIEAYIRTMVRCEFEAASRLSWNVEEWAVHCLHQAAEADRRRLGEEKRKRKRAGWNNG